MDTDIDSDIERNLGPQPIAKVMEELGLKSHDLVAASDEHLTHKMVARACKGRRLTPNVQAKILKAMAQVLKRPVTLGELFNY